LFSLYLQQLYPARHKWATESTVGKAFNIQVAVRFKPGDRQQSKMLLPLHQRLKILKKNEKLPLVQRGIVGDFASHQLAPSAVAQLVDEDGNQISAELLQMLMEAQNTVDVARNVDAEDRENTHGNRMWEDQQGDNAGPQDGNGQDGGNDDDDSENNGAHQNNVGPNLGLGDGSQGARSGQTGMTKNGLRNTSHSSSSTKDQARVLQVHKDKISMYAPGLGVRPFKFGTVFNDDVSQVVFDHIKM
jgi:hypothetical protein